MKKILKTTILSLSCLTTICETSLAQEQIMPLVKREPKIDHIVGVQMNELIRQVFNFNNSSTNTSNNNPYLLIYTLRFKKSGIGIRTGVGYTYQDFTTEDGITNKLTQINELHVRLGIEKSFQLSPKWSTGVGIDGIANLNKDYTTSIIRSFDTSTTKTNSKLNSFGGGAMGWLRYNISPKVLIGTEASFYYTTGTQNQKIEITQVDRTHPPYTNYTTTSTVNNSTSSLGVMNIPVSFFLIVKF